MNQQTTWYLIADSSRAVIFFRRQADQHMQLLREFEHPQSRMANQELVSDRPGRVKQSAPPSRGHSSAGPTRGNHSAMDPHTSPKTVEQENFAHELAAALHEGLVDHQYESLVLVASPQFLGVLRNILNDQVQKHIKASLAKDYTHLTVPEIEKHLATNLDEFMLAADQPSA